MLMFIQQSHMIVNHYFSRAQSLTYCSNHAFIPNAFTKNPQKSNRINNTLMLTITYTQNYYQSRKSVNSTSFSRRENCTESI